jgi:predicted lipoprotein with Yx(FWY)xxD motif
MIGRKLITALVLPAGVAFVAGCGGGSGSASGRSHPEPLSPGARAGTIGLRDDAQLGRVLVDSQGRTLYLFERDSNGVSACSGECANDWPPLRAGTKPAASAGLQASQLGLVRRADGRPQVTYHGHPLYLYEGDGAPGQTTGQGLTAFGGAWYVLSQDGAAVTGGASTGARGGY